MMDATIEKLVYGGDGLARVEGQALFVPFVLPGERVRVDQVQPARQFLRGRAAAVLAPAAERVAPGCPYFGRCGGCQYQHADYAAQLRYKKEIVVETLRRVGKLEAPEPEVIAAEPWQYRNRAQFKAINSRGSFRMGFFHAGSQRLLDVERCPITAPGINAALPVLRELSRRPDFPQGPLEVELFDNGAELLLTVHGARRLPETLAEAFQEHLPTLASLAAVETGRVFGRGYLTYRAAGFEFRVSHGVFFQVNRYLAGELIAVATRHLEGALAFDLFAGAGYFTLPLAQKFARVIAVESHGAAIRDLRINAAGRAEIVKSAAEDFLAAWRGDRPDAVLLDPPRVGLGKAAAARLAEIGPSSLVYVSCDPATLARDLAVLVARGYTLRRLQMVDLFPQTFHIETVATLAR
jgi:23S rRNA (uracil1939-C5)-methyltransferase